MLVDCFSNGEDLGHVFGHNDYIRPKVGVRRDDSSSSVIGSFSR